MDFLQLVTQARTCRRFDESAPLGMDDLEWLAGCARLTPSARNAQLVRFVLVGPGDTCRQLFPLTRWAGALKDWNGPVPGERPTAFMALCLPKDAGNLAQVDVGIVSQTIQLAATSRGWGCCIIYSFDREKTPPLLSIPDDMEVSLVLGLGVAKEVRTVAAMPDDGSVTYWRDANAVHHVPKRSLQELVIGRF